IGSLTLLASTGGNVNVTAGNHTIAAPLIVGTTSIFAVSSGATLNLTNLQTTLSPITKTGGGTLNVNKLPGAALTVSAGTVAVTPGAGATKLTSLSIAAGAKLDLND